MIAWKLRTWRTASAAAVVGAVAACGDGANQASDTPATPSSPVIDDAATPATAGDGGESGEAGAASAYAGLSGAQLSALRLAHLEGFVLAAATVNEQDMPTEAAILIQQGLLEVYDGAPTEFGDLNVNTVRSAGENTSLTRAQMEERIRAARSEIDRAAGALDVDGAIVVARMVDIATGLYQQVNQADYVDPMEYQHSMGAALAARAALVAHRDILRRKNAGAFNEAQDALNRFVELWPQATVPERPTPYRDVLAQSSRIRLALSPYL